MRFDVCHIPPPYLYIRSRSLSLTLRRETTSLREETQTNKHGRQSAAAVFRSFKSGAAADVTAAAATLIRTSLLPRFRIFPRFARSTGEMRGVRFLAPSGVRDGKKWAKRRGGKAAAALAGNARTAFHFQIFWRPLAASKYKRQAA